MPGLLALEFISLLFAWVRSPIPPRTEYEKIKCIFLEKYKMPGMLALEFIFLLLHQDGRVVKALDLSSNGRMSAWVRSPLLVEMVFGKFKSYFWTPAP